MNPDELDLSKILQGRRPHVNPGILLPNSTASPNKARQDVTRLETSPRRLQKRKRILTRHDDPDRYGVAVPVCCEEAVTAITEALAVQQHDVVPWIVVITDDNAGNECWCLRCGLHIPFTKPDGIVDEEAFQTFKPWHWRCPPATHVVGFFNAPVVEGMPAPPAAPEPRAVPPEAQS